MSTPDPQTSGKNREPGKTPKKCTYFIPKMSAKVEGGRTESPGHVLIFYYALKIIGIIPYMGTVYVEVKLLSDQSVGTALVKSGVVY